MPPFEHQRHQPPRELLAPRELIVAVPEMQSHVNLSRILRAAGCCGIRQVLAEGNARPDLKIARDALEVVRLKVHRSLTPAIEALREGGHTIVGLEQATNSIPLPDYAFPQKSLLLVGHERHGMSADWLGLCDAVVEIPIYGRPHSFNAATSAAIAMYEYCRQWPH
ncbi:MAG: TrmH family RNA methyltransferase [Planctomycetota bacterium]